MNYSYNEINPEISAGETSILIPVYKGDNASDFSEALTSILDQTYRNFELVVVLDGPVSKEITEIVKFKSLKQLKVKVLSLRENSGLPTALNLGLQHCEGHYIIRCDADDINESDRFKILVNECIRREVDVLGSQILEFSSGDENMFKKLVPLKHEEIKRFALYRNPMNHMSVLFKKSAVIDVGGYPQIPFKEDYGLWLKMIDSGYTFENLSDTLVHARVNGQFFSRRGGRKHIASELKLLRLKLQLIAWPKHSVILSSLVRIVLMLLPKSLLKTFYVRFIRRSLK